MGGDMFLDGITMEQLQEHDLVLNGDLFTYDPDNVESDTLQLIWIALVINVMI